MREDKDLLSRRWDQDTYPQTPEDMYFELQHEYNAFVPLEMTYSHASAEEVGRTYWSGVKRDWDRVHHMMDRDTLAMQMNN